MFEIDRMELKLLPPRALSYTSKSQLQTLANSEDSDDNAAFHQSLHYLLRK